MPKKPRTTTRSAKKPAKKSPKTVATDAKPRANVSVPKFRVLLVQTWAIVMSHRRVLGRAFGLAWLVMIAVVGLAQQSEYADLSAATHDAVSVIQNGAGQFAATTGILLSSVMTGSLNAAISDMQQLSYVGICFFIWLVTVWLVRHLHAGARVTVRDGLYNAGAPIISTLFVAGVGMLQLIPLAVIVTLFAAVQATGVANHAIVAGVMLVIALLSSVATLYWLTATIFALIIVTIPGTYPLAALRSARVLVRGHRLPLLARTAAAIIAAVLAVTIGLLPLVLLDAGTGLSAASVFIAVFDALVIAAIMIVTIYLYVLYRSMIDARAV